MRTRLAALLFAGLVAGACGAPAEPSPTPIAKPEPTETPAPTATPAPTPKSAKARVEETWRSVRSTYPWMPEVEIRDGAAGAPAYYMGLQSGLAVVNMGDGFGADGQVWHEAGHAALDAAAALSGSSSDDLLTAYWSARGFPGTWQEQERKAVEARGRGVTGFALHQMWPNEMFADSFAAASLPGYRDGDQFPSAPLDRGKMAAFYATLPAFMPGGLNVTPLGALHGDWAFVHRSAEALDPSGQLRAPGLGVVWAIPLTQGLAKPVVRYVSAFDPRFPDPNRLAPQLSPDGKRLVLSVAVPIDRDRWRYALAVVDLDSGRKQVITTDARTHDMHPAWSPDGAWIAFSRRVNDVPPVGIDYGLWVVRPDGSGLHQVRDGTPGAFTVAYELTPDGKGIAFGVVASRGDFAVVTVADGTVARFEGVISSAASGSWRRGQPAFVGVFDGAGMAVADGVGGPTRTLVEGSDLSQPRWRPGSSEVLYLRGTDLFVLDTTASAPQRIATSTIVLSAGWSPSGAEIAYVGDDGSARAVRRDGTQERSLLRMPRPAGTWRDTALDLAAATYP